MILVDTSVWIDYLNGIDSPERWLLHDLIEKEENICITGIILTEILQGIEADEEFRKLEAALLRFPIYEPKGTETYIRASQIYRNCRKKGKTVRATVDCVIAAICLEYDLDILHKDKDFEAIKKCTGLKVLKAHSSKSPRK